MYVSTVHLKFYTRARFLFLAGSKLRLCSANHRAGYFSNLACDWLSIVWAYSQQETQNGPSPRCYFAVFVYHGKAASNVMVIMHHSLATLMGYTEPAKCKPNSCEKHLWPVISRRKLHQKNLYIIQRGPGKCWNSLASLTPLIIKTTSNISSFFGVTFLGIYITIGEKMGYLGMNNMLFKTAFSHTIQSEVSRKHYECFVDFF